MKSHLSMTTVSDLMRCMWKQRLMQEFYVRFKGPEETPFAGGIWKVHVELPDQYPYKKPKYWFRE